MSSVYVLDTSVLVHDPTAFRAFRGTEVAVPVYVIMELDELKTSRRIEVAAAARMASRFIAELSTRGALNSPEGVLHDETATRFRIISTSERSLDALHESQQGRKMDLLILQSALHVRQHRPDADVVLVSKDVNLRILASFEGLRAEDYDRDRVSRSDLFTGFRLVDPAHASTLHEAWIPETVIRPAQIELHSDELMPNEYLILNDELGEHVFRFDADGDAIKPVPREFGRQLGITARNGEQRMALDMLLNPDIQLITLIGRAGTGKTFLALAAALAQLGGGRFGNGYARILLSKPVVALGKDIGYLPGDLDQKLQPWMASFFDNLDLLVRTDQDTAQRGATRPERGWEHLFATHQLEVQPLHTIRGRSISRAFMVIDEAQNLTPHEIKTIITRAAAGTKVVLAGDPDQVDNPFLDGQSNGLVYVTERLKTSPVTATVTFTQGQRSPLAELAATLL